MGKGLAPNGIEKLFRWHGCDQVFKRTADPVYHRWVTSNLRIRAVRITGVTIIRRYVQGVRAIRIFFVSSILIGFVRAIRIRYGRRIAVSTVGAVTISAI